MKKLVGIFVIFALLSTFTGNIFAAEDETKEKKVIIMMPRIKINDDVFEDLYSLIDYAFRHEDSESFELNIKLDVGNYHISEIYCERDDNKTGISMKITPRGNKESFLVIIDYSIKIPGFLGHLPTGVFGLSYQDKIYINNKLVYVVDLDNEAMEKLGELYKKIAKALVERLDAKVLPVKKENSDAVKEFIK